MERFVFNEFQFYLSSIKSPSYKRNADTNESFNSTLVQLKADYISFIFSTYIEFQFYLSSIKRNLLKILQMYLFCFNSTLVQLKV